LLKIPCRHLTVEGEQTGGEKLADL
jgi:hypothetical protein